MQDSGDRPHRIVYLSDDDMPPGQSWAFIDCGHMMCLAIRENPTTGDLEEAWTAYRLMSSTYPSSPNTASAAAAAAC